MTRFDSCLGRETASPWGAVSRWGPRVALRAGAGSAREKAELLAELLGKIGRKAEVVETSMLTPEKLASQFFRSYEQPFQPEVSPANFSDWKRRLAAHNDKGTRSLEIDPGDGNYRETHPEFPKADQRRRSGSPPMGPLSKLTRLPS